MTTMAPTKKGSFATTRLRGQTDFTISWLKTAAHLALWSAALYAIIWVFILPYRAMAEDGSRVFPHELAARLGDEFFLGVGLLICALIIWYMASLLSKLFKSGPLFRVSSEGLWVCQANNFFISRKSIRSVFFNYQFGMTSAVVMELNDSKVLADLSSALPAMASVSCNPERRSVTIELAGVKAKKKFTRSLGRLVHL